jgi:hypothetical protein
MMTNIIARQDGVVLYLDFMGNGRFPSQTPIRQNKQQIDAPNNWQRPFPLL